MWGDMTMKTSMIRQIESIPDLMKDMEPELKCAVNVFLDSIDIRAYKKMILTGCGDSLCSVMAAKFAFMKYTDLVIEVVPVMELSRVYDKKELTGSQDTIVVAVSNSGKVARIIELAKRVKKLDGFMVGITGNEHSGLYKEANAAIKMNIPPFDYAPGIRSYCGCLCVLLYLAVGMGERTGKLSDIDAAELYKEMCGIPELIQNYMKKWEQECSESAKVLTNSSSLEFIGTGVSYASAWFGYAKSLETTGKPSSAVNTEDWFHMNFFVRDVYHTATILLVNEKEGGLSRSEELIRTAVDMGRPLFCITDSEALKANRKILIPGLKNEELDCLIQYIPVSMMMSYLGDLLGESYFRDGKDNWSACTNCATLINSEEIILD